MPPDSIERYAAAEIDELAASIAAAPEEQAEVAEQLARTRAVVEQGGRRSKQ